MIAALLVKRTIVHGETITSSDEEMDVFLQLMELEVVVTAA